MEPKSVGQYQIVRELGRGGMGQVFLARDQELGRLVALKFRHNADPEDEASRSRFRREARALAALNDAGIVTIFEIGEDTAGEFIAMEYVDGDTLREAARSNSLDLNRMLAVMTKIAASLETAHKAGVLHRDIKPENIMISSTGDVKLVDFGIARQVDETVVEKAVARVESESEVFAATLPVAPAASDTTQSRVFGTPAYMAPELLHGSEATPQSDVYALGISLYELLAHRTPYGGKSVAETISKIVDPAIVPRSLADLGLADAELSNLVSEMMDPDAGQRPSMTAVGDRLRALTHPEARRQTTRIAAHSPRRSLPSNRAIWITLIALVLVGGVAGTLILLDTPREGRQEHQGSGPLASPNAAVRSDVPLLAIPPIGVRASDGSSESNALADMLGTALRSGDRLRVATPDHLRDQIAPAAAADPAWDSAADAIGARYVVSVVLREEADRYDLRAEVRDLVDNVSFRVEATAAATELDRLVVASAEKISRGLSVSLGDIAPPRIHSLSDLSDYEAGLLHMHAGRWLPAAEQFAKALEADPELFEAWYRRALALSWGAAEPTLSAHAAKQAERLARSKRDAQLMRGIHLYLSGDFTASLATLSPLKASHPGDRDVLYHLAEAVYHDGKHQEGIALFDELLASSPRFVMAAWHPFQRSLIDRDELKARRYRAVINSEKSGKTEDLDLAFALGEYERLEKEAGGAHKLRAQIVLRHDAEVEAALNQSDSKDALMLILRTAWASYQKDPASGTRAFASYMELVAEGDGNARNEHALLQLGEVLVAAGMGAQLRQLLQYWDSESERASSLVYQALSIHAAALLGDASLTEVGQRNTGLERSASAIRAELSGELARAASLWREALADPHHYYAYMERAALLRVLRKSGEEQGVREACAELAQPAVYRPALLAVRCDEQ